MAEVFGTKGQSVQIAGEYGCSQCGHRTHLTAEQTFPDDHHPDHPWTLMVVDDPSSLDAAT
jgi:hypothetical protein